MEARANAWWRRIPCQSVSARPIGNCATSSLLHHPTGNAVAGLAGFRRRHDHLQVEHRGQALEMLDHLGPQMLQRFLLVARREMDFPNIARSMFCVGLARDYEVAPNMQRAVFLYNRVVKSDPVISVKLLITSGFGISR